MLALLALTPAAPPQLGVLGMGSNVVDVFFKVRSLPIVGGTKTFFADPQRPVAGEVVGGVTLNHLAWAAALVSWGEM